MTASGSRQTSKQITIRNKWWNKKHTHFSNAQLHIASMHTTKISSNFILTKTKLAIHIGINRPAGLKKSLHGFILNSIFYERHSSSKY